MLVVTLHNIRQRVRFPHGSGPLLLGRRPDPRCPHLIVDDGTVSGRHLQIEAVSGSVVRVENLTDADVLLHDGTKLRPGVPMEIQLPARLRIGNTDVEIVAENDAEPSPQSPSTPLGDHRFETVSAPALNQLRLTRQATLASLGQAPAVNKLAEWFETLLSVQRSAVGSSEFYMETARALVDLVGLDRGLVLLRRGDGWNLIAGHAADPRRGLHYSSSIVSMVAEQARTFYGNPQGLSLRTSLANVEALVASPVLDESGAVVGILYGSRDFTPANWRAEIQPLEAQVVQMLASSVSAGLIRLRMQDRLKQVEQLAAVGQAIGYIVHDLRGPLGNAQQLLEMIREGATSTLSRSEQLDFIDASLAVCRELLDDSLEFCRGRVRVAAVQGVFRELLQRHLRLLQMDLDAVHVALRIDAPGDLVVLLDPDRIARVLRNLAKNAAEACRGRTDAVVTIGARETAEGRELWVQDNGPGLPPEVQAKLFQPFETHGKRGGTGFGLAIAKQLVEAHGGHISVVSGAGGTRFTITLPAGVPAAVASVAVPSVAVPSAAESKTQQYTLSPRAAESAAPDGDRPLHPLRVLLVEDGVVNQRMATAMLQKWNHSVTLATTGREALAALDAQPFDVVLMDEEMPDIGGLEATALIRRKEKQTGGHIPIIAMTANTMPGEFERCLAAGMDGYLAKPVAAAELRRALAPLSMQARADGASGIPAGKFLPPREGPSRPEAPIAAHCEPAPRDVVDFHAARERIPGDDDTLRECAELLLTECSRIVEDIRKAVADGVSEKVRRGAHTLRGTADVFAAKRVVAVALRLEALGREDHLNDAGDILAELETEVVRLCDAVRSGLALEAIHPPGGATRSASVARTVPTGP